MVPGSLLLHAACSVSSCAMGDHPIRIHQVDPGAKGREGLEGGQTRITNSTALPIWGIQHAAWVPSSVLLQCQAVGDPGDHPICIHGRWNWAAGPLRPPIVKPLGTAKPG